MRRKYKLTWFARFMIFMVCLTPFCYLGVTQYQENPKVRDIVDIAIKKIESQTKEIRIELEESNSRVDELKDDIDALEAELETLEEVLESKQAELVKLESRSGEV